MTKLNLCTAAWFLALALPTAGIAQLQATGRVRILTANGFTLTGVVTDMSRDSLELSSEGNTSWVRQSDIAYLERSTGRYRKFARNFALTTGSVAATGGMLGAISWTKCVSNEFMGCFMHPETRTDAFLMGAVIGGVLSVPVGVLVGLAVRYDRWEPASMTGAARSRVSVMPLLDRGLGLTASISF